MISDFHPLIFGGEMQVTAPKSPNAGPKYRCLSTPTAIFILSCVVCIVRSIPLVREDLTLFFLRCSFVSLASLVSTLISARHLVFPPPMRPRNCYGTNRNPSRDGVGLEFKSEVCPLASGPRYVLRSALFGTTYLVSVHPRCSGASVGVRCVDTTHLRTLIGK